MDDNDPIHQFFPGQDEVDLYSVLNIAIDAKAEEIKKSYRRLALVYHPDKHATATAVAKSDASLKFQQISFAYAVLSDDKRKKRYDATGKTNESFEMGPGGDGWESYFEDLFDRVTRAKLDEMKKEYQGSAEEIEDLKQAYVATNGSIGDIMARIPHSSHDDEARLIIIISDLIEVGTLASLPAWDESIKDEKSRLVRKKRSEKEAKEAEKLANDLGVWDEFYGSGKVGKRRSKGKDKDTEAAPDGGEEDVSALQALILKKNGKSMDSFFDGLAAKYTEPKKKGSKRSKALNEDDKEGSPKKKGKYAPPEIDEEEFAKLQQKLFGDKKERNRTEGKKGKGMRKGMA